MDKGQSEAYWLIHNLSLKKYHITVKEKIKSRTVEVFFCQGVMLRGSETAAWPLTPERTATGLEEGRGAGRHMDGPPVCPPPLQSAHLPPWRLFGGCCKSWRVLGNSIVLCVPLCAGFTEFASVHQTVQGSQSQTCCDSRESLPTSSYPANTHPGC